MGTIQEKSVMLTHCAAKSVTRQGLQTHQSRCCYGSRCVFCSGVGIRSRLRRIGAAIVVVVVVVEVVVVAAFVVVVVVVLLTLS